MDTHVINVFPELESELLGAIARVSPDPQLINLKIAELEKKLGMAVYAQLLYLLCHLEFSAEEAKCHWEAILEHRKKFQEKLGQEVDFRVALLDYFISVNQRFESPKIIEIKIFQKTQDSAFRDEQTGLYNYRYFRSEIEHEIRKAKRMGTPLSLVLFDVDHFKWYNDHNGHLEGDKALRTVARILREEIRDADLAARYGGEEFVLLLPETTKPQAYKVADRIRRKIAEHPLPHAQQQPMGRFTVSGGLATYRADAPDSVALLEAADKALYMAKGGGRDRILTVGTESRNFPRVEARLPGKLQVLSKEHLPFFTDNLSEQGIQLRCRTRLQSGEYFRFTLCLPGTSSDVEGVACVVRSMEAGAEYEVGARLTEISSQHAKSLKDYLARLADSHEAKFVEEEAPAASA